MSSLSEEFGKNATPAEIKAALKGFHYEHNGAPMEIVSGAIAAFREGRTENLGVILAPTHSFDSQATMSFVRALSLGLTAEEAKTATAAVDPSVFKEFLTSATLHSLQKLRVEYTDPALKGLYYFGVDMTQNAKIEVLKKLITLGADMSSRDSMFLQTAAQNDLTEVADFIASKGGSFEKAIDNAKYRNDIETFHKLTILHQAREIARLKTENEKLKNPPVPSSGGSYPGATKL